MATIFVNPGWNTNDDPITVYVLNGDVYKTDPGEDRTEATCYSSLAGALGYALSGNTIYVYNTNSANSLPIPPDGQSGTYKLNGETYSCTGDRKTLSVQAYMLQLDNSTSFSLSGDITTNFSVSNSIVVGTACYFLVENGAAFELSTPASFVNWGTISVTKNDSSSGSSFSAASASVTNNGVIEISGSSFSVASVTNSVEIKIIGSSFSADSVVNTGNSTFTVTYTSTLNIGNLTGTIKTADEATLNKSNITGGGANGGTITALGNLTFTGTNVLQDVTFNATAEEKTVTVDTSLWVQGTSTLNIGTLNGVIRTNVATTFSNSTISGGDGGLYIYENTDVTFAGENQVNAAYWWTTPGHYSSIINNGLITVKSIPASRDNPNALDYVPAQRGVLKAIDIWNSGSITVGSADAEHADACSIEVINLTNNNSLTVACISESANPSRLKATEGIVNNGMMTLTNSELTATTLTNNGSGISQSTAGMTISNSTVSASGENPLVIINGSSTNTSATIEFNNSTVTTDSVTNYGIDNGTGGNTGRAGFVVNDSTFTVNGEHGALTNHGVIKVNGSTLSAASVINGDSAFWVYGTSTLNFSSLEGTITLSNSNDTVTPVTLSNSSITGKVDNGNLLGNLYAGNPLTFTGDNTLKDISLNAMVSGRPVTIGNSDSLTVKGTNTLKIHILDGTILTDSAAATTLTASSITGGGTNGGTITAQNDLTFNGANTLRNISLNAANKTVTNTGTLTARGALSFDGNLNNVASNKLIVENGAGMTVTGNISNNGSITVNGTGSLSVTKIINSNVISNDDGTITVDALSTLEAETVSGGVIRVLVDSQVLTEDVYHVVDAKLQDNVIVQSSGLFTNYALFTSFDSGVYLFKTNPSAVYVNGNYPPTKSVLTDDGHLVGVNAFTNNPDETETTLKLSSETKTIVYYANANTYAALNLAVDNAPASLTITTEAVGNNEVVTMGPLTIGAGQTVTLSGAKMSLLDATEPAADSLSVSSGSTLNVGGESASDLTAETVNNTGTINVTNSTFAASTLITSADNDSFFVAGESTLNIDSLTGAIKLNDGATVSNSTVYANVNAGETTTSYSGLLSIATGSSVTFAGANTFRDSNNVKGVAIDNLGTVTVKSIAASGDNSAVAGALKVFGFDNKDTLRVGSDTDACAFDVMNLRNYSTFTVNGKTDDLSRLKASSVENYETIELTNAIAEAGSLQNGNVNNTTTTIGITNSEFTADSVTNYSSGANSREGMTVINSTLFKANSLVNSGTIKFRGKNKLDIGSLNGTLYFDNAEGTQATLNDSSITGGTLLAVSVMKFTGVNTLTNITVDAAYMGVTVGTGNSDSLTVGGTSTLKDVLLNGTILTDNSTTLKNSNITGGAITALGSVTVNNSTISSNTFTCNAGIYYGVTFTGENTLDSVTLNASYITNGGSLTVKGESELHIGDVEDNNRENGTIKLDGATIINSSIVGGAHGGTLLVESGKTATFSTTESNSNDFDRTSINNSGTITVNGSMNSGAITNTSGTITVNGTLNSGAITNTSGTITVNGTLNSGAITNTSGAITVNGKMTCGDITNNAYSTFTLSNADVTAGTVTNLAETEEHVGAQISVTDSKFKATSVSVPFYADFHVSGESTLDIGNLTGTIRLNDGATVSNSTVYVDINNSYSGELVVGSGVIFAGSNTFRDDENRGLSIGINGSATVKSTSNQQGELKARHIQVGNLTVGSETDACIVDTISLRNGGTLTVNGKTNERSRLQAQSIENYTTSSNGSMSLTNTVLETETLVNTCVGTLDNKPGITITDSEAFVGSLCNGNESYRVATIKIENSKFTAGSITNYSKGPENEYGQLIRPGIAITGSTIRVGLYDNDHNVVAGTGDITNSAGATITVTNSEFTALGTLTINAEPNLKDGGISFANSTVSLASIVNNGTSQTESWRDDGRILFTNSTVSVASVTNRGTFRVIGTSKLDINALDGTIETSDSGATLNDSSITGGGTNGGTISAQNSLTFTGTNTLNSVTLNATDKTVTVGNSASLTIGGTSTLNIGNLNGTILTDSETTTLTASSITNGTISAQDSLAFTGANTLNSVTLNAANKTVTVGTGATLTINAATTVTAGSISDSGTISIEAGSTVMVTGSISGGTLNVVTKDGESSILTDDLYILVNGAIDNGVTITVDGGLPDGLNYVDRTTDLSIYETGYVLTTLNGTGLFLKKEIASDLVVSSDYAGLEDGTITSDGHLVGYNAFATIQKAVAAGGADAIFVEDGENSAGDVTSFEGIRAEIAGGNYSGYVVNGKRINTTSEEIVTGEIDMTVSGGTYSVLFGAGDYVESGAGIRCGSYTTDENDDPSFTKTTMSLKIKGGEFEKNVAGGMEYMSTDPGSAVLYGDVIVNITGGTYQRYLYGGSISKNKAVSGCTEIYGDVRTTIDATDSNIEVNKIICGSYNKGWIYGTTGLTLTGLGSKLDFIAGGEIWGGCGGDYYYWSDTEPRNFKSHVLASKGSDVIGTRTLTFSGFTGTLDSDCTKIRGFSDMEIVADSEVTLGAGSLRLSDIENWTFENGSSLSGNFSNDFTGDTLSLTLAEGESDFTNGWTLLTDTNTGSGDSKNVFNGFADFADGGVKLNGVSADGYSDGIGWYWGASASPTARLCLEETGSQTSMVLHLA